MNLRGRLRTGASADVARADTNCPLASFLDLRSLADLVELVGCVDQLAGQRASVGSGQPMCRPAQRVGGDQPNEVTPLAGYRPSPWPPIVKACSRHR